MPRTTAKTELSPTEQSSRAGGWKSSALGQTTEAARVEVTIAWATLAKVAAAILLLAALIKTWSLLACLFLALLIAITLWPILKWTRRHRWPDWSGVLICTGLMLVFVGAFMILLVPVVGKQGGDLIESLPVMKKSLLGYLPQGSMLHRSAEQMLADPAFSDPEPLLKHFMAAGRIAAEGIIAVLLVLVTSIYFLADGERVYHWLVAFLPKRHRTKAEQACSEIADVVGAYMGGQLITSILAGVYAFVVLAAWHVPNAALLGVLAGVFDVLPLIGFFLFIVPALIASFMVSPTAALAVGLLYAAYHFCENYFIVPKVYGERLRLSSLTVLICCLIGGAIAGVVGIIAVLPIVASYPIIERIWLQPHLEPDTVEKHEKTEEM